MKIDEIEGVGETYAETLRGAGVATTDDLLGAAGSAAGRKGLAEKTGLTEKQLLAWVNRADLMRISGVGSEYSDLLEAAGVDSCTELAQRNPTNLAQTFQEIDAARPNWIRRLPSESTVADWVAQAAALPKIVTH